MPTAPRAWEYLTRATESRRQPDTKPETEAALNTNITEIKKEVS